MHRQTSNQRKSSGTKQALRLLSGATSLGMAALVLGCGTGVMAPSAPTVLAGPALHGTALGGQQPVAGATIQLYAASSAGYGTAALPLLSPAAASDANGNFDIAPGSYTCPSPTSLVYLVATGGNSGFTNNANIGLMSALGECDTLAGLPSLNVDEVTTVASVYALAPFMSGNQDSYLNVGTSSTNVTGLLNAFNDVPVLANLNTGFSPGAAPTGATVPVEEIYTLANAIASCINSGGGTAGDGSNCGTLFNLTNNDGTPSTAPTDTITAMLDIATHPGGPNVSSISGLATPTAPFRPDLPAAPKDFTLAVTFSAGNLSGPSAMASDADGDIWITNATGNTVTEFDHTGAVLSGSGYTDAFNQPSAISIDTGGDLWITNRGNNTVSRISGSSGAAVGSPYSGGGLNQPSSIAFDSQGTAWVANSGGSVTTINSSGSTLTNYTPAGATGPISIAVNPH